MQRREGEDNLAALRASLSASFEVTAHEDEPFELLSPRPPLGARICYASARFGVNSILCGSLGGYGLNSILLYGNSDPLTYSTTMWDITQNIYLSPFLFIARGVEYTAEMTTVLLVEKPVSRAQIKFLITDNIPSVIEHIVIDTGLLALAVMIYLENVDYPDLLELCMLNFMITLARNFVEVPLNYIGEKILSLDALAGLRNSCLFATPRRPSSSSLHVEIENEEESKEESEAYLNSPIGRYQ